MTNYGGNELEHFKLEDREQFILNSEPYFYGIFRIKQGSSFIPPQLGSFSIYVFDLASGGKLTDTISGASLTKGCALQVEGSEAKIALEQGASATLFVAGVIKQHFDPKVTLSTAEQLKKVIKPWGHELWINGEHPGYALKQIFVRAPHKTSLQYHNFKQETNVLVEGKARLHFKRNATADSHNLSPADIGTTDIEPISTVAVCPPVVHRLEALTDIVLYETSTPHLDDVVRVSDDTNRPDGRIAAEHKQSAAGR